MSDQTESSIVPAAAAALVTSTKLAERTLAARAERQVQVARDGRTLIVSAEGPYTSIAAALAIAEATDTVLVQEGEYEEEAFALHGTQTVIGSDREDVAITITGGTILLQDSCRLEQLAIGGDPLADDSESAPLIRATGTPGLANVDIDVSSRDRGLQVVSGALRARDCELGRVEVMGGAIPSLEGCKLWGLRVAGAFPRLVDCDVWGGTVVSDAGGGTFEDCRLGISPARLWPPYGLVIRDAGTAPVVRRSVIVGGYRGVVFLGGAAGDLENCEITAAWSPGRLAVYIARTDGTGAIADLVERAEAIDVGRVFSSGLPLEATPERFFDPERRPAVAIWDRHTSPRLSRCVLYAPSAIDLDPASSPTLLDYRWIEADMDTGWRALAPPEGPNPDADGPFAAFNNKYLEERLQEYPRRARLWAELRDDVEAGEYD